VRQSALSESPTLTQALAALRRWIETRHFAGYEPFDLLNSPYLSGLGHGKPCPRSFLHNPASVSPVYEFLKP
jgi:hypothetical protein